MADRPIIFSAPMVRALLDGRKTQTRRIVRSLDEAGVAKCLSDPRVCIPHDGQGAFLLRYAIGDRLYVRERMHEVPEGWRYHADDVPIEMAADDPRVPAMLVWAHHKTAPYAPSIHMPRWASRLTLIVEAVKVERLQAISGADAVAEGVERADGNWRCYDASGATCLSAKEAFCSLWASLHTKPGERWEDDPFVVALTFRVLPVNIDQVSA